MLQFMGSKSWTRLSNWTELFLLRVHELFQPIIKGMLCLELEFFIVRTY